jgi:tartrate dehydratase alpha subunit/fumarate hydratase class I-like protein
MGRLSLARKTTEEEMLGQKRIEEAVKNCLIRAGTRFRKDQWNAYRRAIRKEGNEKSKKYWKEGKR